MAGTPTPPNKPGWQTTEFWALLLVLGGLLGGVLADRIKGDNAAIVAAIAAGCYTAGRTLTKRRQEAANAAAGEVTDLSGQLQEALDGLRQMGSGAGTDGAAGGGRTDVSGTGTPRLHQPPAAGNGDGHGATGDR